MQEGRLVKEGRDEMKGLSALWVLVVIVAVLLAASGLTYAQEKSGDIVQEGNNNVAGIDQRLLNEAVILQLGDRNEATVRQVGLDHEASIGQSGDENQASISQDGCESIAVVSQFGMDNKSEITQLGAWYILEVPIKSLRAWVLSNGVCCSSWHRQ